MDINFGETFNKVRECFQAETIENQLTQYLQTITIIRDVAGKIRLFLEPTESVELPENAINDCDRLLREKLGPYYGEDIWLPGGEQDAYKALIEAIVQQRILADWDDETSPRWYILERHLAKHTWTIEHQGNPPWAVEYVDRGYKPAVVAFFSFKGGVGRTTTLAATALTLARNGHRVAIVDLDLEAPGLSAIFSPQSLDDPNYSECGVVDYLIEKKIQNNWRLSTHVRSITDEVLLGDGETLRLLPAGSLDENYLEKLARLDFQNLVDNELPETFRRMLKELVSATGSLDFILLDARAGFHDLGGLAIADISHAAVIFGTQSNQSWAGLTRVVRRLARPLASEQLPLLLIHSMAPPLATRGREQELREFRERAYTVFFENYYAQDESVPVPNSQDTDAPFWPVVVDWQSELRREIALFERNSSSEEASRLSGLVTLLTGEPYQTLAAKLCRMFGRELKKDK
jgi:cellulose biosynthesis protein BcsQ